MYEKCLLRQRQSLLPLAQGARGFVQERRVQSRAWEDWQQRRSVAQKHTIATFA
jgi:hypothetical protein